MENEQSAKTKVGFPDASVKPKKSGYKKVILLVVIILLILGGATWYLLMSKKEETIEFSNDAITQTVVESTPTSEPSQEAVEKNTLKIQIQNGTGTPGDAGKLEKAMNDLGYSETSTGNADNYDYASAEASFGSNFPENYKQEILDKLKSLYGSVKEGSASLGDFDAILVTGKMGTGKSTPTPTKKMTQTPTPKANSTVSPTP